MVIGIVAKLRSEEAIRENRKKEKKVWLLRNAVQLFVCIVTRVKNLRDIIRHRHL